MTFIGLRLGRATAGFTLMLSCLPVARSQDGPFRAVPALERDASGTAVLSVRFTVPPGHYLYADRTTVTAEGDVTLKDRAIPAPKEEADRVSDETVKVYDADFALAYEVVGSLPEPLYVRVSYQGCSQNACDFPRSYRYALRPGAPAERVADSPSPSRPAVSAEGGWRARTNAFDVTGRAAGYLSKTDFLNFIDRVEAGEGLEEGFLSKVFETETSGLWMRALAIVVIIAGGFMLNLTPCVLPMIPINIAIIGAGRQAASRSRGFALGGTYGVAIAVVYGLLGVIVVFTGSLFGTLNSSPWFNLGIAVVFFALSLAMFGLFNIDFSRYQSGAGAAGAAGADWGYARAFVFGGVAALLSGACVAPVLITVLTVSARLYNAGHAWGVSLPFLLGLGMALPWPFAGAGLSMLPKPGRWMERVKIFFGIVILAAAAWYGWVGVDLLRAHGEITVKEGWYTSFDEAMDAAVREHNPLFVDFWASWCKNCLKMEKTTFADEGVNQRLESYVRLKFRAEDLGDAETKAVLKHYGAMGLPTYVVLQPKSP